MLIDWVTKERIMEIFQGERSRWNNCIISLQYMGRWFYFLVFCGIHVIPFFLIIGLLLFNQWTSNQDFVTNSYSSNLSCRYVYINIFKNLTVYLIDNIWCQILQQQWTWKTRTKIKRSVCFEEWFVFWLSRRQLYGKKKILFFIFYDVKVVN